MSRSRSFTSAALSVAIAAGALVAGASALGASPAQAGPLEPVLQLADTIVPVPSGYTSVTWDCQCGERVKLVENDTDASRRTVTRTRWAGINESGVRQSLGGFQVGHRYTYELQSVDGSTLYAKFGPVRTVEGARGTLIDGGLLDTWGSNPHGTFLDMRVGTRRPAQVDVSIGLQAPVLGVNGLELPAGSEVRSASSNGRITGFSPQLFGLTPSTHYFGVVRAVDSGLLTETRAFDVQTLDRVVSATIDPIQVLDDSDDLSDGEITFHYQVGTGGGDGPELDLGTDDVFDPGFHREFLDSARNDPMTVLVAGRDDDDTFHPGAGICLSAWPSGPFARNSGFVGDDGRSDECLDTASASIAIPVVPAREDLREDFTSTAHLRTTRFALQFDATLTYSVSYR